VQVSDLNIFSLIQPAMGEALIGAEASMTAASATVGDFRPMLWALFAAAGDGPGQGDDAAAMAPGEDMAQDARPERSIGRKEVVPAGDLALSCVGVSVFPPSVQPELVSGGPVASAFHASEAGVEGVEALADVLQAGGRGPHPGAGKVAPRAWPDGLSAQTVSPPEGETTWMGAPFVASTPSMSPVGVEGKPEEASQALPQGQLGGQEGIREGVVQPSVAPSMTLAAEPSSALEAPMSEMPKGAQLPEGSQGVISGGSDGSPGTGRKSGASKPVGRPSIWADPVVSSPGRTEGSAAQSSGEEPSMGVESGRLPSVRDAIGMRVPRWRRTLLAGRNIPPVGRPEMESGPARVDVPDAGKPMREEKPSGVEAVGLPRTEAARPSGASVPPVVGDGTGEPARPVSSGRVTAPVRGETPVVPDAAKTSPPVGVGGRDPRDVPSPAARADVGLDSMGDRGIAAQRGHVNSTLMNPRPAEIPAAVEAGRDPGMAYSRPGGERREPGARQAPGPASVSWAEAAPIPGAKNPVARSAEVGAGLVSSDGREFNIADTLEELVGQIRVAWRRGESECRLQLHPEQLGRLEVRLVSGRNGMTLLMRTETAEAQAVIQSNLDRLRTGLEGHGIHLERCEVVAGQMDAGGASWQNGGGQGPLWDQPELPGYVPAAYTRPTTERITGARRPAYRRPDALIDLEV